MPGPWWGSLKQTKKAAFRLWSIRLNDGYLPTPFKDTDHIVSDKILATPMESYLLDIGKLQISSVNSVTVTASKYEITSNN